MIRVSDWASCTPSRPAKTRHHQRAMPSVCGSAWHISASGAPAIRIRVRLMRTA
ncbi:hypothetical protein ACH4OW_28850 [Streptomyces sp. NPDC017056]|uniref:hypothetical protein n=1 Tax=Streptomyces sp. NPDC017056 TaxID=3364973 RepID=UPI0037B031EF